MNFDYESKFVNRLNKDSNYIYNRLRNVTDFITYPYKYGKPLNDGDLTILEESIIAKGNDSTSVYGVTSLFEYVEFNKHNNETNIDPKDVYTCYSYIFKSGEEVYKILYYDTDLDIYKEASYRIYDSHTDTMVKDNLFVVSRYNVTDLDGLVYFLSRVSFKMLIKHCTEKYNLFPKYKIISDFEISDICDRYKIDMMIAYYRILDSLLDLKFDDFDRVYNCLYFMPKKESDKEIYRKIYNFSITSNFSLDEYAENYCNLISEIVGILV